jgi:anthraniloyl-CoA monooxygenase
MADALAAYETERRPAVEKIQAAAETSRIWFEEMDKKVGPDPYLFSYDCMTRSGRVDLEQLREQDATFVEEYERAKSAISS